MTNDAINATILQRFAELEKWQDTANANIDHFFLITMSLVIYFMQCGFAFLEAGSVRSKNTTNILIKNLLDTFIGGVCYWIFGYAFAYGRREESDGYGANGFIGYWNFAHSWLKDDDYSMFFFQFVFAATAATIVSGAVAERCDFNAYLIYSSFLTSFVYPVVTHWAWDDHGWLKVGGEYTDGNETFTVGYTDFAGSGVVHVVGGVTAFVGALLLGPRVGRFDSQNRPQDIKGHSVPLAALGGFILVFGFFAFNGGSQASMSKTGDGEIVSLAIVNTALAASGGGFVTLILNRIPGIGDGKWSILTSLNGCLAGMVAICAGCDDVRTWSGFVIGIVGGLSYMFFTWAVLRCRVDDPLDATAVHFGGGCVGLILVPFFGVKKGIIYHGDRMSGLFLGWNLLGLVSIMAWSGFWATIVFGSLKLIGILRVCYDYETHGLDIPKHGEPAYPAEAYGHGWGEQGDTLAGLASVTLNKPLPRGKYPGDLISKPEKKVNDKSYLPETHALQKIHHKADAKDEFVISNPHLNTEF